MAIGGFNSLLDLGWTHPDNGQNRQAPASFSDTSQDMSVA